MNQNPPDAPEHTACLALGSNHEPDEHMTRALQAIRADASMTIKALSCVWQSPAVGPPAPDYLNAALLVTTALSQQALKDRLRALEDELGRSRTTSASLLVDIDIDLLLFDGEVIDPALWTFAHLAVPVSEILRDLTDAKTGETLRDATQRFIQSTPIRLRHGDALDGWPVVEYYAF